MIYSPIKNIEDILKERGYSLINEVNPSNNTCCKFYLNSSGDYLTGVAHKNSEPSPIIFSSLNSKSIDKTILMRSTANYLDNINHEEDSNIDFIIRYIATGISTLIGYKMGGEQSASMCLLGIMTFWSAIDFARPFIDKSNNKKCIISFLERNYSNLIGEKAYNYIINS